MPRIPFESLSRDLPALGNRGTTIAKNVIPHAGGFRPFPSFSVYSSALTARCQGAIFVTDTSGNVFAFAGDVSKLYRMSGGSTTWADVSKVGGYTTPTEGQWNFTLFGLRVIATNYADPVQSFVIGTSSLFANLGGSPPKAKYIAVVGNFVMLGFTNDGVTIVPERVHWSAINDPTNWPTPGSDAARIVQSDFNDLLGEGGAVQGIVGGLAAASGAVLQEKALWRLVETSPPIIFAFDKVEGGRGTPAPNSIAQIGGEICYLGEDGFYRFDGQSSTPIGARRIDRSFLREVDSSRYDLVRGTVDPINKTILWIWPDLMHSGIPNRLLIYAWELNEWAEGELSVEVLARGLTFGVDLDTDLNANETLADDDSWPSLDSRFWVGGGTGLAGFDSSHRLAFFDGAPLAATLETGEFELTPGRGSLIQRVRPLIDTNGDLPTITAQLSSRYRLADMITARTAYSMTPNGMCFARSRGRYHRVRVDISAGTPWQFAQGVDVTGLALEGD